MLTDTIKDCFLAFLVECHVELKNEIKTVLACYLGAQYILLYKKSLDKVPLNRYLLIQFFLYRCTDYINSLVTQRKCKWKKNMQGPDIANVPQLLKSC